MERLKERLASRLYRHGIAMWEVAEYADVDVRTVQRQLLGKTQLSAGLLICVLDLCDVPEHEVMAWLSEAAKELTA